MRLRGHELRRVEVVVAGSGRRLRLRLQLKQRIKIAVVEGMHCDDGEWRGRRRPRWGWSSERRPRRKRREKPMNAAPVVAGNGVATTT